MVGKHEGNPDRPTVDPRDLSAMALMTTIAQRAASRNGTTAAPARVPPGSAVPEPPSTSPEPLTRHQLETARLLLSEQNMIGRTRMKVAKRLMMRASRLFTHRLVGAGQSIADAVELVEVTHGAAIADVQRELSRLPDESFELPGEIAELPGRLSELRAQLDALTKSAAMESQRRDIDTQSMAPRISQLQLDLDRLANSLHAQLTSVELGVDDAAATAALTITTVSNHARDVDGRLSVVERRSQHDRSELHRTRTLVSRLVRDAPGLAGRSAGIADPASDTPTAPQHAALPLLPATLDDSTYVDFEHRFRGTRDEIRDRQKDALPFVVEFTGATAPMLDLGCGRGEWLDLMREMNVAAYGVDSNTAMVQEAVKAGLDAKLGDALEHLEQLEESSLQGITAFHFVEHVPLDVLVKLLDSALVALRPGGILLLETPNPTNLVVGAANFYLDPTHLRVLHPDFLAFLVESRGYVDVNVHFLHPVIDESVLPESQNDEPGSDARLNRVVRNVEWALFGPQDYIVHARRAQVAT